MASLTDEQKKAVVEAEGLAVRYSDVEIASNEQYAEAGEWLKEISGRIKDLEAMRLELTRPLDKIKKQWIEWFARPLDKLKAADGAVRGSMRAFMAEQEKLRLAEERRLQELAEKEAKKLEAAAKKAEAKGQEEKADQLREKAEQAAAVVPVVASKVEKVAGVALKQYWKFKIVDEALLPREFLCPDEKKLGEHARLTKGQAPIAGVEFYCSEDFSVRR